jgi:hypothetical protein
MLLREQRAAQCIAILLDEIGSQHGSRLWRARHEAPG